MAKNLTPNECVFSLENLRDQMQKKQAKIGAYIEAIQAIQPLLGWYAHHPENEDGSLNENVWIADEGLEAGFEAFMDAINAIKELAK